MTNDARIDLTDVLEIALQVLETLGFTQDFSDKVGAIFEGLADHETREGRRVVIPAGPGHEITALHRARVFQSSDPLEEAMKRPDLGLGPPPSRIATAGRMNAWGISVFYGALDPTVALAEIRPPVGSRVIVGKFIILRPLRLLDVEALKSVFVKGSIFDPAFIRKLERARFLGRLSDRITRPVMPNDEPTDYLVTQAIADYLATEAKLDGIIYPSAQAAGAKKNVVLFHHAARVQLMELPKDTELDAHTSMSTEEGPEANYWVWEEVPPEAPKAKEEEEGPIFKLPVPASEASDFEDRETTLQLDLESLEVHHIEAVQFTTERHAVKRHRSVKGDHPF
ncbi:MAG TPA: RES family NAD+ phosphorylase [Xanthobacteraceae bacterium]